MDADGNTFRTWNAYVVDRLSGFDTVSNVFRAPVVRLLVANGLSMREAAKAAGVSAATASNDVNGRADGQGNADATVARKARTAGDGTVPQPATAAVKALESLLRATSKFREQDVAELSDDQLVKLAADLKEIHGMVVGQIKLNRENAKTVKAA